MTLHRSRLFAWAFLTAEAGRAGERLVVAALALVGGVGCGGATPSRSLIALPAPSAAVQGAVNGGRVEAPLDVATPAARAGGALALAAGRWRTCAILEDRSVKCWGDNSPWARGWS